MIDEAVEERAALWVLGLLPEGESARFSAELGENPELAEFVNDLQRALEQLALEVPQHAPPVRLKQRVLAEINGEVPAPEVAARDWSWLAWAAAAVFFCGCLALLAERGRMGAELAALRQQDSLARLELVRLNSQLAEVPGAGAVAVWDGEKQRGVLDLAELPQVRADQDYQLWMVDPAYPDPVDAGVIKVRDGDSHHVAFGPAKPIRNLAKLAVSLERHGGAPKAEGPMVLLSK